ncbi:GNAT family N-acetyltransferase [Macrococcoides bohemicum]|uniref:GNAT family N-acetyltransferase n=1 Tax=Macrococcoides bohemicum TaxID=1903056 RepID=UPI001C5FD527|nr:GNAT family N-acetyltransferase [Macrococcus bohemicus]QYA45731.1 GNAT family N-acetyltransferase [Macrococcus bohemicus]
MNLDIRIANINDINSIYKIDDEIFNSESYFISTLEEWYAEDKNKYKENLLTKICDPQSQFLVATMNNVVIGYIVAYRSNRMRTQHNRSITMGLTSHSRGKGIGKQLLKEIISWAINNDYVENLCLGVLSTNINAIKLYQSCGFVEEGRFVNEYKFGEYYIDDIYMKLNEKKRRM